MYRRKILLIVTLISLTVSFFYKSYFFDVTTSTEIFPRETEINRTLQPHKDFLIHTTNCKIPDYTKKIQFHETKNAWRKCGERVIFINRISNEEVMFIIHDNLMFQYYNKNKTIKYKCCYQHVERSKEKLHEDSKISYTNCKQFKNGTKVLVTNEIFKVTCFSTHVKPKIIYEDAYLILKKQNNTAKEQSEKEVGKNEWNVLVVGLDTMSRGRLFNSMPHTADYLKTHNWLDFRGYQKVDYNTFPNLMAVLTGSNLKKANKECVRGMHLCNHLMIWSDYKKAGYMTAYGEDYLRLPDTFDRYTGFKTVPTDHYTRPFFLIGEQSIGNLICLHHKTSPQHLLDYAYDFANAYEDENFLGVFWLNSISHNGMNLPALHDFDLIHFFKSLNESGVMNNTFVVLLSDHGIRFGQPRVNQIEYYYEERLPMLFVWTPLEFRKLHEEEYFNMLSNQHRLTTPYDLHLTLSSLIGLNKTLDACPLCTNLFNPVPDYRTCSDAGVHSKWCTCNILKSVDINSLEAKTVIDTAVKHIQETTKAIKTTSCMKCSTLNLKHVHRMHSYQEQNNRTIYVTAFQMTPGKRVYEANILEEANNYSVLDSIYTISSYYGTMNCVVNRYNREYCICEQIKHCKN